MLEFTQEAGIAEIVLCGSPVNALSLDMISALEGAVDRLEAADLNLVIFRSKLKVFSAGADLGLIRDLFEADDGVEQMIAYVRRLHSLFDRIEALPAVSLAVIEGSALGGGLELALACDLRLVSEDAVLGLPEARLGMIPGAGGTQRLSRICGPSVSSRLILSAETVAGQESYRLGIATWLVKCTAIDAEIARLRREIGSLSRVSLAVSKACIAAYCDPAMDGFAVELDAPKHTMRNADTEVRIANFFAARKEQKARADQKQISVGE